MELVGTLNGINFWVIGKDEVVVDRLMWLKVKCHLEALLPVMYPATKPMEQCGTAHNNARDKIAPRSCLKCESRAVSGQCFSCKDFSNYVELHSPVA